jgi:hypothetical protein
MGDVNQNPEDELEQSNDTAKSYVDKEQHSQQMVRCLQGRLKALASVAVLSAKVNSSDKKPSDLLPRMESQLGQDEPDSDREPENDDVNDNSAMNALAYRNPHTPHTEAERRMEGLFSEYQEEIEAASEAKKNQPKKSKSSRKTSPIDLVDRERRRKRLKSLQIIAENNSTKFLSRSSNSIVYRAKKKWPIPINENEMNPKLFLDISLQMIQHPGICKDIETLVLHPTSEDLLVHAFWYMHVQFFQKISFSEQTYLQTRISNLYPGIIAQITQAETEHKRDMLFRTYPLVIAKAIYLAFVYLCPGGGRMFQGAFQRVLSHSIFRLLTGVDICKDSVDFLRQKLYHDQFVQGPDSTNEMSQSLDEQADLPRQQQRITVDAYKITPLLQKYLTSGGSFGGDTSKSPSRTMLKRTIPTDHCQVGGVCTYRPTMVPLSGKPQDDESRLQELKSSIKKKAVARKDMEGLHAEQQELLKGPRRARSEFVNNLLTRRHQ